MALRIRVLNPLYEARPARRSGPTSTPNLILSPYLLLVLLATLLGARAATLEIPIFAGGYGTAFYEETAREFERLRPGTKLNVYGDPRIADKLRVRVIDGSLPDGMLPRDVLIPALVKARKLIDLTPFLDGPNWEGDGRWRDTFMVTSMFKEFQVGRATAIAVVLFGLVIAGSALVMRGLKRESVE